MSIRTRNIHFTNWAKVIEALADKGVTIANEEEARTFLTDTSSDANPYYYYVGYIKDTQEIYTHGKFYKGSDSLYDDTELRDLIGTKADLSDLETLSAEVEENEEVTAAALTELHENKADKSEIPDVSTFATKDELNTLSAEVDNKVDSSSFTTLSETVSGHTTSITNLGNNKADKTSLDDYVLKSTYNARVSAVDDALDLKADKDSYYTKTESDDKYATKTSLSDYAKSTDLETAKTDLNSKINLKQDKLTSGTNIKTVNNNSILGSGNIETPDTKVTSAANHYGYNSNNATSTTGAFVTKITKDAANHVTSFESRSLTSTDIPGLDASKITSGTIDIARLPKGALEQLHHYETKELAQQAVIDKAVQLGDTVQINNATMYICTSDSATTFATQFTEYVAGTAASVPWSGITGKPTGIDEWGNRIGVIESNYQPKITSSNKLAYSLISGTPDLSVYALKTTIPTKLSQFTDDVGYFMTKAPAGTLPSLVNIGGYGYENKGWKTTGPAITFGGSAYKAGFQSNYSSGALYFGFAETSDEDLGSWKRVAFTDSNVASATKLATARTIWGQSFDGTGNIDGEIRSTNTSNDAGLKAYGAVGSIFFGVGSSGTNRGIYDLTNNHWMLMRDDSTNIYLPNGNVAIGATSASAKLHVHGDIKASSSITTSDKMYGLDFCTTSDNRLKDFTKDVIVDFNELKNIPKKYYYWKDKSMGEELQIGTSAQELAKVYPECVHYDETNDRYSVNYQKLSIVALAAIDKLHDRISELESKLYD